MSGIIYFLKLTIGGCKLMQVAIFANIFVCTVLTDLLLSISNLERPLLFFFTTHHCTFDKVSDT